MAGMSYPRRSGLLKARRYRPARTVSALVIREMTTSYGRSPGGYIWAILEPVGAVMILSIGFSRLRQPTLGTSFVFTRRAICPFHVQHRPEYDYARRTSPALRIGPGSPGRCDPGALIPPTQILVFTIIVRSRVARHACRARSQTDPWRDRPGGVRIGHGGSMPSFWLHSRVVPGLGIVSRPLLLAWACSTSTKIYRARPGSCCGGTRSYTLRGFSGRASTQATTRPMCRRSMPVRSR